MPYVSRFRFKTIATYFLCLSDVSSKIIYGIDVERWQRTTDIRSVHGVLWQMHKEVCNNNNQRRSRAQQIHNARTSVLPISIGIGVYVVICAHAKRNLKLQSLWRGLIKVIDFKPSFMFTVEDITTRQCFTVCAQRIIPYHATRLCEQTLHELKRQSVDCGLTYNLVEPTKNVRKRQVGYEVLEGWVGFEKCKDETWEPMRQMLEGFPRMLEDFLHMTDDRSLKREVLNSYF